MLRPLTADTALALLAPSARVLIAVARTDGGIPLISELPWSEVHWPTLLSLASYERAETQLYRLLRVAPAGVVPAEVLQTLQGIVRVSAFRSAVLSDAATEVSDALAGAGVPALWLKGAALALQQAKGFAARAMGDLDLLLLPGDMVRARRALCDLGWAETGGAADYAAHHHAAPMLRSDGARLELHTALFPRSHPFVRDSAEVWLARSVSIAWGDRVARVLPVEWHVVHATVHWAWSHEGEVGSWQYLHDMHRLASQVDWEAVEGAAERIGAQIPTGWGLWAADALGVAAADPTMIDRLRGGARRWDSVAERQWLLRAFRSPAASPSVRWSRFWWTRAMRGLGSAAGHWPWLAEPVSASAQAGEQMAEPARVGAEVGRVAARWRRHLAQVLRS
jgi:Uncharacterised nucleotidyltransferase